MEAGKRLYPTTKEEREYHELRERYGFKDAAVAKAASKPQWSPKKTKGKK